MKIETLLLAGLFAGCVVASGVVIAAEDATSGQMTSDIGASSEISQGNWTLRRLGLALSSGKESRTPSIRRYIYEDRNSAAHIDIDIIGSMRLGGQNSYMVSTFAWSH